MKQDPHYNLQHEHLSSSKRSNQRWRVHKNYLYHDQGAKVS